MSLPAGGPRGRPAGGEAGFSLVAAVFLIVVLAALGAFAVQVAMTQYQGANVELLEARAQAAAETGIEYGANLALQSSPTCAGSTPLGLTPAALTGFVVTVTCTATPHPLGTVYALTATATFGGYGTPDYVVRKVTRNVTTAPP